MWRILLATIFVLAIFIVVPLRVFAVTITISGIPSGIDQNSEFDVNVTFLCQDCEGSYLRGVFYPSGTNYFGYTQNKEGNWINVSGTNCAQYYPILQSDMSPEGTWSGKIKVKPDTSSSFFKGPGEYLFKIARYSSGCNTTWSEETTIGISGPMRTPTPSETPIPTHTPIPTKTPTFAPIQTSTPTLHPSPTNRMIPSAKPLQSPVVESRETDIPSFSNTPSVLGESRDSVSSTASSTFVQKKIIIISFAFIGSGLAVLATAVAYGIVSRKNAESNPV
jgi:hypothetical protein